jgi:predicted HNH restriction endonuclease
LSIKSDGYELIKVDNKIYKRDNKAIALIKLLRDFKCQICGTTIVKKNGSRYIEAAHNI